MSRDQAFPTHNHDHAHGEAGREPDRRALFEAAVAHTKMRPSTINAARTVILEGATFQRAARENGIRHRQQVGEVVARILRAMRAGAKLGEKKRCPTCGAVLNKHNNRGKHDGGKQAILEALAANRRQFYKLIDALEASTNSDVDPLALEAILDANHAEEGEKIERAEAAGIIMEVSRRRSKRV